MSTDWVPKPTVGAVPQRAERYGFSPVSLPTKPDYAKDPRVLELGERLMKEVLSGKGRDLPDPWARRYAWRKHPFYSPMNVLRNAFPGLGIAVVTFGIYLGLEATGFTSSDQAQHH
jgi:NADH dehydrogenase (ubiquinone) 1 beta subcomplex subunit 3